jgi:hypothetical protein
MATMDERPEAQGGSRAVVAFFGVARGIASTVYGTVTVMATIAVSAHEHSALVILELVLTTALVLWVAHVYAHGLSESIALHQRLTFAELRSIASRESGIVLAALLPATALLIGAVGWVSQRTAVWIAIGAGLATLAVEGVRYARIEEMGRIGTAVAVGANLLLGLCVVILKVAIAH